MNAIGRLFNSVGGQFLVRSGRAGWLTTTGRRSGQARRAAVGFATRPDGGYFIGAGGPGRAWAANLRVTPACTFEVGGTTGRFTAQLLEGAARDEALAAMSDRMGSMAERAAWQEVFALLPEPQA